MTQAVLFSIIRLIRKLIVIPGCMFSEDQNFLSLYENYADINAGFENYQTYQSFKWYYFF